MPRIDEILERTAKAKYFSSLDLKDAYHLLRIKKSDQWNTAFICPNGTFEYTVMPFGLKKAPGQFQRFIEHVLSPLGKSFVLAYLDDILVFSNSEKEHEQHLTLVLQTLQKADLRIKPSKCSFFKKSVPFLGFHLGQGNLSMNSDKVESIKDWEPPTNVKSLQRFLRFINFYRRFIPNLSKISQPLNVLLTKDHEWKWTKEQQKAFDDLREIVITSVVLKMPDPSEPFILEVDASASAIGCVLSQKVEGKLRPCAFHSRSLNSAERNWPIFERETLALREALKKWRHFLEDSTKRVTVFTDHKNISQMQKLYLVD
jgi:RNase H-like domain found in reverse transcriptase/Reverse transcriptase (RNA-dependent DNA polymerase)